KGLTTEERNKKGIPSEFASRLAAAMRAAVEENSWGRDELKYSIYSDDRRKHMEYDDDIQPKPRDGVEEEDVKMEVDGEVSKKENLVYDRDAPLDCSLVPRPIGFNLIPQTIQDYAAICLAWSNVIRGFAFNPANELVLASHHGLLRTTTTLLMLYTEDEGQPDKWEKLTTDKREMKSFLLDVANQLRDDAFTFLSAAAGSLDLFTLSPEVSCSILGSVIHWSICRNVLAFEQFTVWGGVPLRDFCLEIIGKMTVREKNIRLLVSTVPEKKFRTFIKVISGLLHTREETQIREFALVIMNAICQTSKLACVVAGTETDIIKNAVTFIEVTDANMFRIISQQGVLFLRQNQDSMGTTFEMLKKACNLLISLGEQERCKSGLLKHVNRLENMFLMHYVDAEIGSMLATVIHMAYHSNICTERGQSSSAPISNGRTS
ncbi:hypothetical protein FO519_002756, partial [Halicephalobus sp. NKZ332]